MNIFCAHSKCFATWGFFDIKFQNVLNNCKINALQSPLGCLDMSIGYTDMICVTHLSVMVLSVLFCLGDQQQGLHSLIWKTLLTGEGWGFLPKSIFWRRENKPDLAGLFFGFRVTSFSFCLSLNVHCWPAQPSSFSLSCNSSNTCRVFFLCCCQSLSQASAVAVSGAETTGPSWGQSWLVFLPWHHLPVGSNSCFETTAAVWLLGVSYKGLCCKESSFSEHR